MTWGDGTRLRLGGEAVVEVTGLRNPCVQLDRFQPGLMAAMLDRDGEGRLIRKASLAGYGQACPDQLQPARHLAIAADTADALEDCAIPH